MNKLELMLFMSFFLLNCIFVYSYLIDKEEVVKKIIDDYKNLHRHENIYYIDEKQDLNYDRVTSNGNVDNFIMESVASKNKIKEDDKDLIIDLKNLLNNDDFEETKYESLNDNNNENISFATGEESIFKEEHINDSIEDIKKQMEKSDINETKEVYDNLPKVIRDLIKIINNENLVDEEYSNHQLDNHHEKQEDNNNSNIDDKIKISKEENDNSNKIETMKMQSAFDSEINEYTTNGSTIENNNKVDIIVKEILKNIFQQSESLKIEESLNSPNLEEIKYKNINENKEESISEFNSNNHEKNSEHTNSLQNIEINWEIELENLIKPLNEENHEIKAKYFYKKEEFANDNPKYEIFEEYLFYYIMNPDDEVIKSKIEAIKNPKKNNTNIEFAKIPQNTSNIEIKQNITILSNKTKIGNQPKKNVMNQNKTQTNSTKKPKSNKVKVNVTEIFLNQSNINKQNSIERNITQHEEIYSKTTKFDELFLAEIRINISSFHKFISKYFKYPYDLFALFFLGYLLAYLLKILRQQSNNFKLGKKFISFDNNDASEKSLELVYKVK